VLYQLLTGKLPRQFDGPISFEAARQMAEQSAPRLSTRFDAERLQLQRALQSTWRKQLRGDLDAILDKALRYEPELRYRSIREFADDLERLGQLETSAAAFAKYLPEFVAIYGEENPEVGVMFNNYAAVAASS
jgi:serine/threonine protein kinase